MAEVAAPELQHTVTIEDAGPSRKRLKFEVPASEVDARLAESLDTLATEAELPGFRKGRAPRQLIEKRFGQVVRREAKTAIVSTAYQKAVEDHKLRVIGEPMGGNVGKAELKSGEALTFEFEVEVAPEFQMPAFDTINVLRPTFDVTDEMVAKELSHILINEGELEQRDTPEPGDYLTGHGVMTGPGADGATKEFHNINGAVVRIPPVEDNGKGMILGVVVDDFAKQFGLPKPGETATITVTGPEHHENEEMRGKPLTVTFKVDRVDRIIPANVADVVARYGMTDEAQIKDAVKARLNQRVIIEQQSAMRRQVAKHLLDSIKMDLPQRLTAAQAQRTLDRRRAELLYRGVPELEIEKHAAELRSASAGAAIAELKLFFILNQAADDLKVTLTEGEVNARIAQIAASRGVRPEALRKQLIDSRQIGTIIQQVREHKAMDAILAKAKVEDVSPDDFKKRLGEAHTATA